ncbi:MAG: hypothetical protein EB078_09715 [Proteobacteria bacterium]|nr:hypothetical protein [Pseudomonadota bacterium]NDC24964.1 hypothetical protein [Pseudomonadota bacterium]NDD05172.1 hypothetical protein [Pseudomonadota bacterium]NDG28329.1 hypothetical protein [Pseudomonadota bacterium]
MKYTSIVVSLFCLTQIAVAGERGLSDNPTAKNSALLVSSAHGLPGLDYDVDNVELMTTHPSSGFSVRKLEHGKGTVANIAAELTRTVDSSDASASHLFFFTGHGSRGAILAEDRSMKLDEIKKALLKGREKWGPMARFTFMIDACYSGSLIDPLSTAKPFAVLDSPMIVAQELADAVVDSFSPQRGEPSLFKSLFALVSARSDETCLAGSDGSAFTVSMKNAWDKAVANHYTIEQFIKDTQKGTKGSHPTSRLVPAELAQEPLINN